MKELTRAEEEIMQILWDLERGYVKDIIDRMEEPKPAYNTVSTIVRILVKKGFVKFKSHGKTHEYFPAVAKDEYSHAFLNNFMGKYFSGSFENMVSFLVKENKMSISEVDELMKHIKKDADNE